jgi:DNA-binding NtrC family response regulator
MSSSPDPDHPAGGDAQVATDLDAFDGETTFAGDAASRIYLVARLGETTRVLQLDEGSEVTVGRAPESTIVVDDTRVSRCHARIVRARDGLHVEDLGSRNGTHVNGTVVRSARRALAGGDALLLGPLELVVAAASGKTVSGTRDDPADPDRAIVADQAMVQVFRLVRRVAATPTTVLIFGETGVGKELVAEHLHLWSSRAAGPFVRLNCASLPEALLESELFGYERGAFTGADRRKVGYLEAANGGTLLLDEIGELPMAMQAKLLRALETRRVPRVGGTTEVAIDVRFIGATHRDLLADVEAGRFRRDLYYRVCAFTLKVPPLRQRPTEITLLAELFAREFASVAGFAPPRLGSDAIAALRRHAWPGNVRELRNAVEHAVIMSDGAPIGEHHLPEEVLRPPASMPPSASPMRAELSDIERRRIEETLEREGGNQTRAAQVLGISRRNLVYKMAKHGIKRG